MKTFRTTVGLALCLALALTGASLAGDKQKCDKSAEECLTAMAKKLADKGYLGIQTEKNDHGYYVVAAVNDGTPAAKAGFRAGDVLVALNGVSLYGEGEKEMGKLKMVKSGLKPGSELAYTVKRSGGKKTLNATLTEVPRDVLAQWIGEHMIDQHAYVQVASK